MTETERIVNETLERMELYELMRRAAPIVPAPAALTALSDLPAPAPPDWREVCERNCIGVGGGGVGGEGVEELAGMAGAEAATARAARGGLEDGLPTSDYPHATVLGPGARVSLHAVRPGVDLRAFAGWFWAMVGMAIVAGMVAAGVWVWAHWWLGAVGVGVGSGQ